MLGSLSKKVQYDVMDEYSHMQKLLRKWARVLGAETCKRSKCMEDEK